MSRIPVIKILAVKQVGDFALELRFSDDKVQIFDFEPFLRKNGNPEIQKYLELENFRKYILKDGELMWGDFDLIFPVADLYGNSVIE